MHNPNEKRRTACVRRFCGAEANALFCPRDYSDSLNVMKLARPCRNTRMDTERFFGKS